MTGRSVATPRWRTLAMLALLALAADSASAQRAATRSAQAIRAEYAAVLLQSGRYPEAAREYRTLLASNPRQADYRLGLARALAWGGQPRDAERELRALRAQRPNDAPIEALLRSVRESYEPTAQEAEEWLADAPTVAPYRLALARALVRERAPRAAVPHYDLLLVLGQPIESRPPVSHGALLGEAALARAASGDRTEAARMLREALARSWGDTAVRHALAVVLAGGDELDGALAQYDTLLAPSAPRVETSVTVASVAPPASGGRDERTSRASLLLERAHVQVDRGDLNAAERDTKASLNSMNTVGGFLLLGDLASWRGQYAAARDAYEHASALQPGARAVGAALGRLAREEHPALAFAPMESGEEGWRADGSAIGDNLGVRYLTVGARRGVALPGGFTVGGGVELRELADDAVALHGYAAELAASQEGQLGALYGRIGGHGGLVSHPGLGAFSEGSVSVASWYGVWGAGLDLRSELAYPSLLTIGALRPSLATTSIGRVPPADQPLRAQTVTASIAGAVARGDLALVGQRTRISDGNVRSTIQLFARYPVAPHVALLYAGSSVAFTDRSTLYWDPLAYVSNATGLEYAVRRARGLSFALQALPGFAWSNESPPSALGAEQRRSSAQIAGAGDASYRTERWDAGGAVSYSRGRAGAYQQLGASVRLRVHP